MQEREPLPLLPQDKLALLRTIPVLLAMLFPADAGTVGMDATGAKLLQRCLSMIKQKPVVAAYGDVPVALTTTLFQLSPFMAAFGGPWSAAISPVLVCCALQGGLPAASSCSGTQGVGRLVCVLWNSCFSSSFCQLSSLGPQHDASRLPAWKCTGTCILPALEPSSIGRHAAWFAGQDNQANALTPLHQLNGKQQAAVAQAYDLVPKLPAVRKAHDEISEAFCGLAAAHQEHWLQGKQAPPQVRPYASPRMLMPADAGLRPPQAACPDV